MSQERPDSNPTPQALLRSAPERLADAVRRAASPGMHGQPMVVRLSVPTERIDPIAWLRSRPEGSRAFWGSRGEDRAIAMWGVADQYEGSDDLDFDRLASYINHMTEGASTETRYFGGFRFDPERESDPLWESFGTFRFVLPRFEYIVDADSAQLVCNLVIPRDRRDAGRIADSCLSLAATDPGDDRQGAETIPPFETRNDEPDRSEWLKRIGEALSIIDEHTLQKVVLARRTTLRFGGDLSALDIFGILRGATPNRFHYFIESDGGPALLGATPERLFRREGRYLFSEAVAGTRPRVDDVAGDEALLDALMHSEKDQREHLSVRWAIEEILRPFCEVLSVEARASEMRLAHGRHLVSRFEGVLRSCVSSWDLVRHLHPTPAVGGYPARAALRVIRGVERFDRGWYAGPVGCVGNDFAEFAVALRCGVVSGPDLHLFTGAGIVTGSEPESEWDEIEHKIVDFARVLGLTTAGR